MLKAGADTGMGIFSGTERDGCRIGEFKGR